MYLAFLLLYLRQRSPYRCKKISKKESLHNVQTWQKYETKFYLNGK